MSESGLAAGKIRFFNHSLPGLDAGVYRITAEQTVNTDKLDATLKGDRSYTYSQSFAVRAPRFRFGPGDVHSVFPPPLSAGKFDTVIPHIVLRRQTLPWERTIDGQGQNKADPSPWLALLLFRDSEMSEVKVRTGTVKDLMLTAPLASEDIRLPQFDFSGVRAAERELEITPVNNADPQVTVVEIGKTTFAKIAPRLEDLKWLAHVRAVNTGDKELLGMREDGKFSLVMSNRVPGLGGNIAHLVSIEGCKSLLEQAALEQAAPGAIANAKVRVVSLASWSFTVSALSGNFAQIANNLDAGLLGIRTPESLNAAAASKDPKAEYLKGAIDKGYVPLTYRLRSGDVTAGWYRGPLTPVAVPRAKRDPFATAEAGLIYDPGKGLFDVSNAVAWQIGRLLALSDARFTAALGEWRQEGQMDLDKMIHQVQADRRRQLGTIWAEIGEVLALDDGNPAKKDRFLKVLQRLQDTGSPMDALTEQVIADYKKISDQDPLQAPQDTKIKLTGEIGEALDRGYQNASGKSGIFGAAAFRDVVLEQTA